MKTKIQLIDIALSVLITFTQNGFITTCKLNTL